MASYKDSPNLKFSPYVQTLPIEAMAKVGMYKQQRYDQGVQKIQKSIDNIAGLDIVRPEDKQYLQSKLNQLGSQLSSVAGGDFSNFALVNSVNGMTNQIAKDPRVLKDVASSSAYRKALEGRTKLVEQGKGSASNDMLFNEQVNSWMNGGEDASFNSTYRPYSDYESKKREIIKTLTAEKIGKPVIYGPNGKLLDAMTYTEVEELSPQKILTALKQGLSPDEYQQLQIDGRYKYANVSKEQFVSDVNSRFTTAYDKMSIERSTLNKEMNALKNPGKKQEYQSNINRLSNEMANLKQQYETTSESFLSGDVESAKARLYANDWFNDSANVYKYKNVKQEYKTNPALQVQMQRQKMAQDAYFSKLRIEEMQKDRKYKVLKDIEDQRQKENEKRKEQANENLENLQEQKSCITVTTSPATGGEVEEQFETIEKNVLTKQEAIASQMKSTKSTIVSMTETRAEEDINKDGKINADDTFQLMLAMYDNKSPDMTLDMRDTIDLYLKQERQSNLINKQITTSVNEADELFPEINYLDYLDEYEGAETLIISNIGDYEPGVRQEETYEFSPQEALKKFVEFENSSLRVNKYNFRNHTKDMTPNELKEYNRLTDGEDEKLISLYNFWNSKSNSYKDQVVKSEGNAYNRSSLIDVTDKIKNKVDERKENWNKAYVNKLQNLNLVNENVTSTVRTRDAKEKEILRSNLTLIVGNETMANIAGYDQKIINNTLRTKAESASLNRDMSGEYSLSVTVEGGQTDVIPLTQNQAEDIFSDQVLSISNPQARQFDETILPQMIMNQNEIISVNRVTEDENGYISEEEIKTRPEQNYYTTALNNKYTTNPGNSYFKQNDFKNIDKYVVTGNLVSSTNPKFSGDLPIFYLKLNVWDPNANNGQGAFLLENHIFGPRLSKINSINSIQQISDEVIEDYLKQQKKEVVEREQLAKEQADALK